ncbi:hypothetical protein G7046_g8098 [Stylonectria norvegica]|nr:hypothetical protein G7046_g8098 [Stylonectria norvegica]
MAPTVFILLHRDTAGTTTILSVFTDLQDANASCLAQAHEAKVDATVKPHEPLRWAAADGTSTWVERHTVSPRKSLRLPPSPKRKGSNLYDNDEDDVIEVQDKEPNYD